MVVLDIVIFAAAVILAAYGIDCALRRSHLFPWLSKPAVNEASALSAIDEEIEVERIRRELKERKQLLDAMRSK